MKKKVIVGMSGGVDSSAAAYLLKEEGYDVIGVTLSVWCDPYYGVRDDHAIEDAKRIAEALSVSHRVIDVSTRFKDLIVDDFAAEYARGATPNPCVRCNPYIKWQALLSVMAEEHADAVATGHFANILKLPNGRFTLEHAVHDDKDQTYALYRLSQEALSKTLMPCGAYSKEEVRQIAARFDIGVSGKKDSQEICFIPDDDHSAFLQRRMPDSPGILPGSFVDKSGRILGTHNGIIRYTIGQRKGLNLAMGHPVFVTEIRPETNEVVIGESEDLFSRELHASEVAFMAVETLSSPVRAEAKARYSHLAHPCTVSYDEASARLTVLFDEPQRAITKGQSVVVYQDGHILCGGKII